MKKYLLVLLVTIPGFLSAQYFELGILIGASNYMGDLSSNSTALYFNETKPAAGLLVRYNMSTSLALRANFNYATVSGTDANVGNKTIRERNLSFQSNLYEFAFTAEYNIPGYEPYNYNMPFSPYLFAGLAFTGTNPQAEYNGEWVDLQPLGTEGQGMRDFDNPYNKVVVAIPFGVGFKYALTDKINLGLEVGARKTFSDYIDDVSGDYADATLLASGNGELAAILANRTAEYLGGDPVIVPPGTQRGDSASSDWYFIAGLTVSYNFMENGLVGSRRRRSRSSSGCPTR